MHRTHKKLASQQLPSKPETEEFLVRLFTLFCFVLYFSLLCLVSFCSLVSLYVMVALSVQHVLDHHQRNTSTYEMQNHKQNKNGHKNLNKYVK